MYTSIRMWYGVIINNMLNSNAVLIAGLNNVHSVSVKYDTSQIHIDARTKSNKCKWTIHGLLMEQ